MSHQSDLIATDILAYLHQHEHKELLRFITCGSVDDGKSTLIGRLLFDSKMLYEDQLAQLENESKTHGTVGGKFDPALVTDGLKAEREQGITIDVAYRYFSTAKRKFIIADTPGHEQYTRTWRRCIHCRLGGDLDRCSLWRANANASPQLHRFAAWNSPRCRHHQQNGLGRFQPRAF